MGLLAKVAKNSHSLTSESIRGHATERAARDDAVLVIEAQHGRLAPGRSGVVLLAHDPRRTGRRPSLPGRVLPRLPDPARQLRVVVPLPQLRWPRAFPRLLGARRFPFSAGAANG